jgi:hypothetical protein
VDASAFSIRKLYAPLGDAVHIGERDLQAGGVAAELLKTLVANGDGSPGPVKLKPHRILFRKGNSPPREREEISHGMRWRDLFSLESS